MWENAMAFIPVPDGIKVCMRFTKAGQQVCNVFYVTTTSTVDDTFLDGLGAALKTWWTSNVGPGVSSDVALQAIELTDASVSGGLGIEYTTGLPVSGSSSGTALPNNVTLAIKLASGLTGRSNRGRQYLIGLPANSLDTDQNHVSSAAQSAIKGWYDSLISDIVAYGAQLVIASFFTGGAPRTTAVTHEVGSVSVNPTIDSQRRRLPERGS